ncbi:MAG: acyl-CoA dehydrogenase family protein [Acidimicrobiales bacterium]
MSLKISDPILEETLERLLADACDHEAVQAAEALGWAPEIWAKLAETGAPWVGVPADGGGSGGTLSDAMVVLRCCGRHAVPLPVAETGVLGGWLLAGAGLPLPDGAVTVVPGLVKDTLSLAGGRLSGTAHNVPWARAADRIVALVPDGGALKVVSVPGLAAASIVERRNLAGEPREIVTFDAAEVDAAPAPAGVDEATLRLRGAWARGVLMAGALERIAEMVVQYTLERHQFGQQIGRFQAVQHLVVAAAQEAQLALMAVNVATAAAEERGGDPASVEFEVAALKAQAGESATVGSAKTHQAHGAIGMTQEYALHHFSRRLWSWREEFGATGVWQRRLGELVAGAGADQLWKVIQEGTAALSPA